MTEVSVIGEGKGGEHTRQEQLDIQLIKQGVIDAALEKVNSAIDEIKKSRDNNVYRCAIGFIADAESRINQKGSSAYSEELGKLLVKLKEWKAFVGTEAQNLLIPALKNQGEDFKNRFPLSEDIIQDLLNLIQTDTLDGIQKRMETSVLLGMGTKGSVPFHPGERARTMPSELKTHWATEKGRIPELLILIDLLNLMYLKVELLSIKTVAIIMGNLGVNVNDIIEGSHRFQSTT